MAQADKDFDGEISIEEFTKIMSMKQGTMFLTSEAYFQALSQNYRYGGGTGF